MVYLIVMLIIGVMKLDSGNETAQIDEVNILFGQVVFQMERFHKVIYKLK